MVRDLFRNPITVNDLRPEVVQFAVLMERQLRKNDFKGGWKNDSAQALWPRIFEELEELGTELNPFRPPGAHKRENIGLEAADVANFLMMVTDRAGALE